MLSASSPDNAEQKTSVKFVSGHPESVLPIKSSIKWSAVEFERDILLSSKLEPESK